MRKYLEKTISRKIYNKWLHYKKSGQSGYGKFNIIEPKMKGP